MNSLVDPKTSLEAAKTEIDEKKRRRAARIDAIEDYVGLITTKVAGAGATCVGLLEWLSPDFILSVLPQPLYITGAGIAMLAGKKLAKPLVDALAHIVK